MQLCAKQIIAQNGQIHKWNPPKILICYTSSKTHNKYQYTKWLQNFRGQKTVSEPRILTLNLHGCLCICINICVLRQVCILFLTPSVICVSHCSTSHTNCCATHYKKFLCFTPSFRFLSSSFLSHLQWYNNTLRYTIQYTIVHFEKK